MNECTVTVQHGVNMCTACIRIWPFSLEPSTPSYIQGGKRFAAEFGEVRVERIECGGIGWTDNKGSETTIEGYSMAESKSSLEGESRGEFKAI